MNFLPQRHAFPFYLAVFVANLGSALSSCVLGHSGITNGSLPATYLASGLVYNGEIDKCECQNTSTVCVRKCCAVNYSFVFENQTCVFDADNNPEVPVEKNGSRPIDFHFVTGMVDCSFDRLLYVFLLALDDPFVVQDDGRLSWPKLNVTFDTYCLEEDRDFGMVVFFCDEDNSIQYTASDRLNFIGIMISLPFLFLTFVVYALLPDRNLHGSSLMCYVASFFIAGLVLVIMYLAPEVVGSFETCRAMAMLSFYFFMASICWMNVMSYDIYSTFSGTRGFPGARKRTQWRRFSLYSLYAWGLPLVQIGIILLVSHTAPRNAWYNPNVSDDDCWIKDGIPELLYNYGPLAVLITVNIVLFGITACRIRRVQKDTAMLTKRGSKKHSAGDDDKMRFKLYIKLLFAMGINWSMEIITWAVNWQVRNVPPEVWYLTDFINAAFGVFIFFIFVFSKSIWKSLKKRYYMIRGVKPVESGSTTLGSSSSQR